MIYFALIHFDYIEAHYAVRLAPDEKILCRRDISSSAPFVHRLGGRAERVRGSGLDLYKRRNFPLRGDYIDLAERVYEIPFENFPTAFFEIFYRRRCLTFFCSVPFFREAFAVDGAYPRLFYRFYMYRRAVALVFRKRIRRVFRVVLVHKRVTVDLCRN